MTRLCFDGMRSRIDRRRDVREQRRTVEQIAAFDRFDCERDFLTVFSTSGTIRIHGDHLVRLRPDVGVTANHVSGSATAAISIFVDHRTSPASVRINIVDWNLTKNL